MAIRSLYTGATGMIAQSIAIDNIANNIANVNTVGFKSSRANFEDLFYQKLRQPGMEDNEGNMVPTGLQVGLGVKLDSTQKDFTQGSFRVTNRELDVAIEGDGFFKVRVPEGIDEGYAYTRAGNFTLNADGDIVTDDGYLLEPSLTVPQDTTSIQINPDGVVQVQESGSSTLQTIGTIELSNFLNPQGLESIGHNLFVETDASGDEIGPTTPGLDGTGFLRQGALEISNVSIVQELVKMIEAQRAFEFNSQTIRTSDEVLQMIANLRR